MSRFSKAERETFALVDAILVNGRRILSGEDHERLLGAQQAFTYLRDGSGYLGTWLSRLTADIRALHAEIREGCDCGVCKVMTGGK